MGFVWWFLERAVWRALRTVLTVLVVLHLLGVSWSEAAVRRLAQTAAERAQPVLESLGLRLFTGPPAERGPP